LCRIQAEVDRRPDRTRRDLSLLVCEWLKWHQIDGRPRDVHCRVALARLSRRGALKFPETTRRKAKDFTGSVAAFRRPRLTGTLDELGPVELLVVKDRRSRLAQDWRALMQAHYLGAGPLCGAQLRYLIHSAEHGYLGALAFSAAAWRVDARDRFIGWNEDARSAHLRELVANSRFLIHPMVRVPHLASHVLALATRRLPEDWQARYGLTPLLLETYVERKRFAGTCYRAANWQYVGTTMGRGRQDRHHRAAVPQKDVYLYPLDDDWQNRLSAVPAERLPEEHALSTPGPRVTNPAGPVDAEIDWAALEWGGVDLGDARLAKRLVTLGRDRYARPQANLPQSCGSRAKTKAAYRLLDHPEATLNTLLAPHVDATVARMLAMPLVLVAQDTTSLNYSAHPATEEMGPIGTTETGPMGLILHDSLAFTPDGTPLGLLHAKCWKRDGIGKKHERHHLPIEDKESVKWLDSFNATAAAAARCPHTQVISIGDREADIYELFALASKAARGPGLLVRARHDRVIEESDWRLITHIEAKPASGIQPLHVPRQGSRAARVANLTVRYGQISLPPPDNKKGNLIKLWAVLAREEDAPAGVAALNWLLLTTVPTTCFEAACERLQWYAKRWGIEVFHRTLKSGCKIENRQLGHARRLEACLAIDMVVAWRIFHLTKLGREIPDVPCTVYFEEAQWQALTAFVTRQPRPPKTPPTLRETIRMVASLGGFLGRKGDGEPGTQTLWLGLQRLDDITEAWKIFTKPPPYYPLE
jgi:hypothetical protein